MISTWLDQHIEEWIKPKIGKVPVIKDSSWYIMQWQKADILALQAVWKEGKKLANGRKILLAGRDVWLLEMLARIEGFPTIFRPDISSYTKSHVKEDYRDCYLLDTGFRGTVPKALGIENFGLIKYNPEEYYGWYSYNHQVFPRAKRVEPLYGPPQEEKLNRKNINRTLPVHEVSSTYFRPYIGYRGYNGVVLEVATKMEASPKYWKQGDIITNSKGGVTKLVQTLEAHQDFSAAAQVTIHIAKNLKESLLSSYGG